MIINTPTESQLRQLATYWQKVMRLQDWIVDIRYQKPLDLSNPVGANGETHFNPSRKEANITIVHPRDARTGQANTDIERTVVHELLHLHTSPMLAMHNPANLTLSLNEEEAVINCLSLGFVRLKRHQV